jgi:glycosyltransferase involved in cell wall biosynthesis
VSVIIPTYGHRDFVLDCLESVFSQTFAYYEVIVVNDCSPDDTAELLRPLVESGRIRYFEQPNAGQASARNRGLSEARGEFIAFLDDDDSWPPDKLEWQVELLRGLPRHIGVAGSSNAVANGITEPSGPVPTQDLSPADFIVNDLMRSPGQVLFRRQALVDVGGLDTTIWGSDDWDLYFRISALGPIRFEPRLALLYRVHAGNASKNYWRMRKHALRVYRRHRTHDPKYNWLRWVWGHPPTARFYRDEAATAATSAKGRTRLLHRLRSLWCGVCLIPEDAVAWARITGGRARQRLGGNREP